MNGQIRTKTEAEERSIAKDWGSITWLASGELTGSGITVGRVVIRKGMSNPRHGHNNCEEVLYLLKGKLEHSLGVDKVIMKQGDPILVPAGVLHNAVSVGDTDAEMIVAYSSGERDFQKEE